MPHKCAMADCMRKAEDAGVILFSLPKTPAIRDKWLQFANIDARENRIIRICNVHFKDSDIWKRYPRPLLRLNCVPCFKQLKNKLDNDESIMNVPSIPNVLESVRQEEESNMESSCSTHGMTCAPSSTAITNSPKRRVSPSQCLSPKTKRFLQFKRIIHNLRSKCNRLRQKQWKEKGKKEKSQLKLLEKASRDLPADAQTLILSQMKLINISKYGRRYDDRLKDFALSIYYHSPKAYRFLRKSLYLPTIRTLRTYQQKFHVYPGVNTQVINMLQAKFLTAAVEDKVISLVFDEIHLHSEVYYGCIPCDALCATTAEKTVPCQSMRALVALVEHTIP